ncbi:MAG: hypothetical protein P1U61_08860 [Legionellaceae bacterium]|nr:hypothetical protein [Legionellaceae bacterium]
MHNKTEVSRLYPASHTPNPENRETCFTHHSLKIWFTKPESDDPLGGIENELRLIEARVQSPEHHILLVYEPHNLTIKAQKKLSQFCHQHHIQRLSLDDLESALYAAHDNGDITVESADTQLALLDIAKRECHSQFGDLAAASDIVRILTPALHIDTPDEEKPHYGTRIYTDLDESLSPDLPHTIALEKEELLKKQYNNNFLFAHHAESPVLHILRQKLLTNYQAAHLSEKFEVAFTEAVQRAYALHRPNALMTNIINFCGSESSDVFLPTLQGMKKQLQTIQNDDHQYTIDDIFTLRCAIKDLKSHATTRNSINFLDNLYLKLVVEISGPGLYDIPEINSQDGLMTILKEPLKMSDLSWVPGSPYQVGLAAQIKHMDNHAKKIQATYRNFLNKKHNTSNPEHQQTDNTISEPMTTLKTSLSDLKKPDKPSDEDSESKPEI